MDKKKLAGYALMGLSSALLVGCQNGQNGKNSNGNNRTAQSANGQAQQSAMTPEHRTFQNKLSTQGGKDFEDMSPSDREKAVKEYGGCAGKNSCKGMGGCSTTENSCKGQNSCKGMGGCSKTPEEAVSVMKKKSS